MRRPLTLKWVLPLGLAIVLLLITGLSSLSSLLSTKAELASTSRADLLNHTAHLARMVEQGLRGSRSLVEADVGHVSTDRRVTAVLILDNTGRVLLGHRRAWLGQLAAERLPGFDDAWRQSTIGTSLPELRVSPDGMRMESMHPFNLPATETEIRSTRHGVVYARFDLTDTWQAAKYEAIMTRLPSLVAILLTLLLVAWLLQRHVARPLARLGQAASALALGRLGTRLQRHGRRLAAQPGHAGGQRKAPGHYPAGHWRRTDRHRCTRTRHPYESGCRALHGLAEQRGADPAD